ncbi:putative reverse transcriptase domain-containing protein, partial [Tanacetum coccineum]
MPSYFHKKFCWGTIFITRHRSFIEPGTGLRMKRTNHRTRVLIGLYPCHIEEKITVKEDKGESIMEWKTKLTTEEEVKENEGLKEVGKRLRNVNGGNDGCSYKTFMACNPKEFDGKGGAVSLTRWIEKMESVFENSGCTANQRVRFHELAKLVPHLVTPESSRIKRYIHRLAPQIHGMLRATQPTTIQSAILMAGILIDEAVHCGTLTKGNDKRKEMEELSRQVVPVNVVKMGKNQRACYECGSLDHLLYDCPKWKQSTGPAKNPLALEGNKNTRNNGNQARGKDFNGNAIEALQDPKVMTGTFSLNNQFATVLFDSGVEFSFIST